LFEDHAHARGTNQRKKMKVNQRKMNVFALLLLVSPTEGFFWGSNSKDDSADKGGIGKVQEYPVATCGATVRLPANYPANLTLGLPEASHEKSVEDFQAEGRDYISYMKTEEQARAGSNAALGAKFRNFRRKTLEMYWDDGSEPGHVYNTL
jgi:hypothetical protein